MNDTGGLNCNVYNCLSIKSSIYNYISNHSIGLYINSVIINSMLRGNRAAVLVKTNY